MDGHLQSHDQARFLLAIVVVICLQFGALDSSSPGSSWSYEHGNIRDADTWYLKFPDCGGVMQSPINIDTNKVVYDPRLEPLDFSDFDKTENVTFKLENVGGHTAEVVKGGGSDIYLNGGSLPAPYKIAQLHFHWGRNGSRGSEHSINGKYFPLEVHFVCYQKRFRNIGEAANRPFGLAVYGCPFKIGEHNYNYDKILDHFDKIRNPDDETDLPTFPLKELLPASPSDYYRYMGSLTTPPCSETVIWSLCRNMIEISSDQLEQFRSLYDEHHHRLGDDYRPVQPLNRRTVLTNKKPPSNSSDNC